jgi:5-methylcytosine-specific restriction endonuclease McrA
MTPAETMRLKEMAKRRYRTQKKRCELLGKAPPQEWEYLSLLTNLFNHDFSCHYCGKKLKLKDVPPFKDIPSVDHYIPLTSGGGSDLSNLVVCCVACNIVKGTMRGDTFEMLFERVGNTPLWDRMVTESFKGRFADKMQRIDEDDINTQKEG